MWARKEYKQLPAGEFSNVILPEILAATSADFHVVKEEGVEAIFFTKTYVVMAIFRNEKMESFSITHPGRADEYILTMEQYHNFKKALIAKKGDDL